MPGQPPTSLPRAPLPASVQDRSARGRDRRRRPRRGLLASAISLVAALAVPAAPASAADSAPPAASDPPANPAVSGPAAGDSVPAPAVRLRPDRWVPDAPAPGGLLWIERHQGPAAGAENLLFAHGALSRIENRLLPTRLFEEERFFGRLLSAVYRLGRFAYLDWPAVVWLPVVQHELFGHGWLAREAGYEDIRYEVPAPPPYGPGGGMTRASYPDGFFPDRNAILAMSMGGIEAEDILAQRQRTRFLRQGHMDYPGAIMYLSASLELSDYVAATDTVDPRTSNDVSSWLFYINSKAGRPQAPDHWITLSDLEKRSRLALADPFLWYAAWATGRYLWDGSMRWRQPMIPLGPVRWLPSLGYRLSPFGGQYLAENLLAMGPRVATLRAAWGDGELGASWGADVEAQDAVRWRGWSLDATLRAWSQPPLRPDGMYFRPPESPRLGGGMSATAVSPALSRAFPLRLGAGFSAKRAGYVPGESLEADFALRAGIGWYR